MRRPGCGRSGPGAGPVSRCSRPSAWSASTWPSSRRNVRPSPLSPGSSSAARRSWWPSSCPSWTGAVPNVPCCTGRCSWPWAPSRSRAGGGRTGRAWRSRCARWGRGRFRGSRRARAAAFGAMAAVGDGVRDRRARVPGGRTGRGRHGVAAPARPDGGRRAAVAGGGRHGRRVRVLVHGHAADRRGARHAVLRSHPGRRRLHRPARRHGLLRRRAGRRERRRRRRSRPGVPCVEQVSGCRRGSLARRAPGRRSSGSGRSRAAARGGPWG